MLSGALTFGEAAVPQGVRKAVSGASIGNAVEWYDFAIYGFLATFIAANFFPAGNETAALLNTFAIFAAAFVMRPLGRSEERRVGRACSTWCRQDPRLLAYQLKI